MKNGSLTKNGAFKKRIMGETLGFALHHLKKMKAEVTEKEEI
jgi:hypothetical protein